MKTYTPASFYQSLLKKFSVRYSIARQYQDNEQAIHKLRVIIKRINAFLLLIKSIDPGFEYKKHYKPLHRLFRETGLIRDPALMRTRVKKILDLHGMHLTVPGPDTKPDLGRFKKDLGKAHSKAATAALEKSLNRPELYEAIARYLDRLTAEIRAILLLQPGQRLPRLHELRKNLKELQFNLGFARSLPVSYPASAPRDIQIKSLVKIIGQWHDIQLILADLDNKKPVLRFEKGATEIKQLVRDTLLPESTALEAEIDRQCLSLAKTNQNTQYITQ